MPSLLPKCLKMGCLIVALVTLQFCRIACLAYPAKALSAYGVSSTSTPLARWYPGANRGRDTAQIFGTESGSVVSQAELLSTRNSRGRSFNKGVRVYVARFLGVVCFLAVIVAIAAKQYPSEFSSIVNSLQRSAPFLRLREYVKGGEGGDESAREKVGTDALGVRTVATQTPSTDHSEPEMYFGPQLIPVVDVEESLDEVDEDEEEVTDVVVVPTDLLFEEGSVASASAEAVEEPEKWPLEPSESEELDAEIKTFLSKLQGTAPVPQGVDTALWHVLYAFENPVRLPKPSMTKKRTRERVRLRLQKMSAEEGNRLTILRRCRWHWSKLMHVMEAVMSVVCDLTDLIEMQKRIMLTLNALQEEENLDKFIEVYYGTGQVPEGLVSIKVRKATQARISSDLRKKLAELSPRTET